MMLTAAVLSAATIAAAAIDVRTRRIPNAIPAGVALVAVAIHLTQGPISLLLAIASLCGAFALGAAAFAAGWFGGGDVKLIAACCGLVGFPDCVMLVLFILVFGALLSLAVAARRGHLVILFRSTAAAIRHGAPTENITLPYAVSIAAGSIAYVVSTSIFALRVPV
jgi:prepilin peptidase CpaA